MNDLSFKEKQAFAMLRGGASFDEAARRNNLNVLSLMELWQKHNKSVKAESLH